LDKFHDDVDYTVFDDIQDINTFDFMSWFGGKKDIMISGKYHKDITLRHGKPTIWIANEEMELGDGEIMDWIHANSTLYKVCL
jgi:hypothetical protein